MTETSIRSDLITPKHFQLFFTPHDVWILCSGSFSISGKPLCLWLKASSELKRERERKRKTLETANYEQRSIKKESVDTKD